MLRAVVLLLMLPSMLVPPGLCICRFVPIQATSLTSSPADRHLSTPHASNPRPDCSCDSCHARKTSTAPAHGDNRPADEPVAPAPVKHWPGCPAAADAAPLNMVVPVAAVPGDLLLTAAADFFTPIDGVVASPARASAVPLPTTSPPLFISHCSLLI